VCTILCAHRVSYTDFRAHGTLPCTLALGRGHAMDEYTVYTTPEHIETHPNSVRTDYVIPGLGDCSNINGYVIAAAMPGPATTEHRYLSKSHTHNVYYGENGRTHNPNGLPFAMTRYEVRDRTTTNLEYRRPYHSHQQQIHTQRGNNYRKPGFTCGFQAPFTYTYEEWNLKYNVVYSYVNEPTPQTGLNTYTLSTLNESSVVDRLSQLQAQVTTSALTQWDALTDITEIAEVPALAKSISSKIFSIFRTLRSGNPRAVIQLASNFAPKVLLKHPNRAFRALGDQWMEYRYGIMPLIYSYRDLCKSLQRGTVVRDHKYSVVTPEPTGVNPPSTGEFYTVQTTGYTRVGASIIQRFAHEALAQLASIGFNPFVTAWEEIPFSFVADWFVNVGEYITARTSSSYATELYACTSRRDSIQKVTMKHMNGTSGNVVVTQAVSNPWVGSYPAVQARTYSRPDAFYPVKIEQIEDYVRAPFDIHDVPLRFHPSVNWRRAIDGAVLSITNLRRLLSVFSPRISASSRNSYSRDGNGISLSDLQSLAGTNPWK